MTDDPRGFTYDQNVRLGHGFYASVFLGRFNNKSVAVKRVLRVVNDDIANDKEKKIHEILENIHENVVSLLHSEFTPTWRFYVLEKCRTSLDHVIARDNDDVTLPSETSMLYQMASGLCYIHGKRVIHLDIKPDNILISEDPRVLLKICDFGLSVMNADDDGRAYTSVVGASTYSAPEILKVVDDEDKNFLVTFMCDVFVAGCVFFNIVKRGLHPFGKGQQITYNILTNNQSFWKESLDENHFAYDSIEAMLNADSEERSNALNDTLDLTGPKKRKMELFRICSMTELNQEEMRRFRELLVDEDVDINGQEDAGFTPFLMLCLHNRSNELYDCINSLIGSPGYVPNPDQITHDFSYLFTNFNNVRLLEMVRLLLPGEPLNGALRQVLAGRDSESALVALCENYTQENLIEIVDLLIQHGADVNQRSNIGRTALHSLCRNYPNRNLLDIVQLLVDRGAQVNVPEAHGWTALHCLSRYYAHDNLVEVARLLIGSDIGHVQRQTVDGWTASPLLQLNPAGLSPEAIQQINTLFSQP